MSNPNEITNAELDRLVELAGKATPAVKGLHSCGQYAEMDDCWACDRDAGALRDFNRAANPDTILALAKRCRDTEASCETLRQHNSWLAGALMHGVSPDAALIAAPGGAARLTVEQLALIQRVPVAHSGTHIVPGCNCDACVGKSLVAAKFKEARGE